MAAAVKDEHESLLDTMAASRAASPTRRKVASAVLGYSIRTLLDHVIFFIIVSHLAAALLMSQSHAPSLNSLYPSTYRAQSNSLADLLQEPSL